MPSKHDAVTKDPLGTPPEILSEDNGEPFSIFKSSDIDESWQTPGYGEQSWGLNPLEMTNYDGNTNLSSFKNEGMCLTGIYSFFNSGHGGIESGRRFM